MLAPTFEAYWNAIQSKTVKQTEIHTLFLARVTAYRLIASSDDAIQQCARQFLLDTMTDTGTDHRFVQSAAWVTQVTDWEFPEIIALRSDTGVHAILYEIRYRMQDTVDTLRELAFFEQTSFGVFKFSHKYDLKELEKLVKLTPISMDQGVRQLGDTVLHRPAMTIENFLPETRKQMEEQISIMKSCLAETGGVGIAANQLSALSEPLNIIIAGIDYSNPLHVAKALTRYPTTLFPQARVFVNPTIVETSQSYEPFPEGCLSVQGVLRALVLRPSTVTIRYMDCDGSEHTQVFMGADARVMLHELDHIAEGKVYLQRIIEELALDRVQALLDLMDNIPQEPRKVASMPYGTPTLFFKRDTQNKLYFEMSEFRHFLMDAPPSLLASMRNELVKRLITPAVKM